MSTVTRVAAFDCGTNTIKVLVADLDPVTGEQVEIVRDMRMVRLGQGIDETGAFADEALGRVFAAIEEFAPLLADHGVEKARFCATSAARDADNVADFVEGVTRRLGIAPEIVTGGEEARLSYVGATRSLPGIVEPSLVLDIGGGSTEFVTKDKARSIDIGSVRLTERFAPSDPPTAHDIEAMASAIDTELAMLARAGIFPDIARTVIAVGGTATTVAAMALDLPRFDRAAIHHSRISRKRVHEVAMRLLEMTVAERRALPFMHPGRADVIGTGALIFDRAALLASVDDIVVSESDILDGIAWSLV